MLVAAAVQEGQMTVIGTLWASVQGDPAFMRRVGWLADRVLDRDDPDLAATGWISSVEYAALSLWAPVPGHWSAWQAARVEVRQEIEAKLAREEPVEDRIVAKLVTETEIQPTTRDAADNQHATHHTSSSSASCPSGR